MSYYYEKTTWSGVCSPMQYPESLTILIGPFSTKEDAETAADKARKTASLETCIGDIIAVPDR